MLYVLLVPHSKILWGQTYPEAVKKRASEEILYTVLCLVALDGTWWQWTFKWGKNILYFLSFSLHSADSHDCRQEIVQHPHSSAQKITTCIICIIRLKQHMMYQTGQHEYVEDLNHCCRDTTCIQSPIAKFLFIQLPWQHMCTVYLHFTYLSPRLSRQLSDTVASAEDLSDCQPHEQHERKKTFLDHFISECLEFPIK